MMKKQEEKATQETNDEVTTQETNDEVTTQVTNEEEATNEEEETNDELSQATNEEDATEVTESKEIKSLVRIIKLISFLSIIVVILLISVLLVNKSMQDNRNNSLNALEEKASYNDAFYYNSLNDEEKEIYSKLFYNPFKLVLKETKEDCKYLEESIEDKVYKAKRALCNDFPQYELLKFSVEIKTDQKDIYKYVFKAGEYLDYSEMINEINDRIKPVIEEVEKEDVLEEKYKIIYKYLTENFKYEDYEDLENSASNILGPLTQNRGVCDGIADSFKYICNLCGLQCIEVEGSIEGEEYGHKWLVAPNSKGVWKLLDPTWDLGKKPEDYEFFMIDDLYAGFRTPVYENIPGYKYEWLNYVKVSADNNKFISQYGDLIDFKSVNSLVFDMDNNMFIITPNKNSNYVFEIDSDLIMDSLTINDRGIIINNKHYTLSRETLERFNDEKDEDSKITFILELSSKKIVKIQINWD